MARALEQAMPFLPFMYSFNTHRPFQEKRELVNAAAGEIEASP